MRLTLQARFEVQAEVMVVQAEALDGGHRECQLVGEFAIGEPQADVLLGEPLQRRCWRAGRCRVSGRLRRCGRCRRRRRGSFGGRWCWPARRARRGHGRSAAARSPRLRRGARRERPGRWCRWAVHCGGSWRLRAWRVRNAVMRSRRSVRRWRSSGGSAGLLASSCSMWDASPRSAVWLALVRATFAHSSGRHAPKVRL
jgi:hypothetical protein